MDSFSLPASFFVLIVFIFHFKLVFSDQSSSFSFQKFDKDPNFLSNIAVFGDAGVYNGSLLKLTHSVSHSAGLVVFKKPIKLVEGKPMNSVSFSSYFSFSISSGNGDSGDGLSFVVMAYSKFNVSNFRKNADVNSPFGVNLRSLEKKPEFVAVEFDTRMDSMYGDLNGNHVGINVGNFTSVKAKNVSSVNLVLNSGKKLSCWIDYEAGSERLDVRLSHFGDSKPVDPLLSYPIDLSKLCKDEKVYIGLSSSNGNSSQECLIYSWSFEQRHVPHWMHSQPLDPQAFTKDVKPIEVSKRSNCFLRVLAAMIFGTACGALGAFCVLYLWTIFGNRRPVVPEECAVHPVDFEYKKVDVVLVKAIEDGKQ